MEVSTTYHARHTEFQDGPTWYAYMADAMLCVNCTDWRDVIAHPEFGEGRGSARRCAQGTVTYAGTWKPCFRPRTEEQRIAAANKVGQLF